MTSPSVEDRHVSPYTFREKAGRLVWSAVQASAFRYSWVTAYRYRRALLRFFGAKVGSNVRLRRSVRIECPWNLTLGDDCIVGDHVILYCLGPVTLGQRVMVSQNSHLCAGSHDHTRIKDLPLLRLPITIHDDAWVAADAFVGPSVTVGEGALLGARGCAFKNLEPWTIYGGNPAKPIKPRDTQASPAGDVPPEGSAS